MGTSMNCGARRLIVRNCTIAGSSFGGRHLVYLGGGARDGLVAHNQIHGLNSNGLNSTSRPNMPVNAGNVFRGNIITGQVYGGANNANAAISITGGQQDIVVEGNQILDCADMGVYISGIGEDQGSNQAPIGIAVRGNKIARVGQQGIRFETVRRGEISGNDVLDATGDGAIRITSFSGSTKICDRISVRTNRVSTAKPGSAPYASGILFDTSHAPTNSECHDNVVSPGSGAGGLAILSFSTTLPPKNARNRNESDVSYSAGATQPSVLGVEDLTIANTSGTIITGLVSGQIGQVVRLAFGDGNSTLQASLTTGNDPTLHLADGRDFEPRNRDAITLQCRDVGGPWIELSRSENWKPSDEGTSNCALWFDARASTINSGTGITDGTSVSTWHDQSGNTRDATSTNQPVWHPTGAGGLPYVQFNGTSSRMTVAVSADYPVSNPTDWLLLALYDTSVANVNQFVLDTSSTSTPRIVFAACSSSTQTKIGYYDGAAWSEPGNAVTGPQMVCWDLRTASNNGRIARNGPILGAAAAYTQRRLYNHATILGASFDESFAFFNGKIYQLALFANPSDALRRRAFRWKSRLSQVAQAA